MKYEIIEHEGFVEVITSGDADLATFRDFLSDILSLDTWVPGTPLLTNHTRLNSGPLTVDDIDRMASLAGDARVALGPLRLASLVSRDLEFGLARMWEVYVEEKWDGETAVFRSRDDAISWLLGA